MTGPPRGARNRYDADMNPLRKFFCVLALGLWSFSAAAQTAAQGDLLVASTDMADPNFTQSVLLLLRHNESGTIGVLINRPTNLAPGDVFEDLDELTGYGGNLYYGGPVLPTRLLLLLRDPPARLREGPAVVADIYVSGDPGVIGAVGNWDSNDANLRFYAGHTAWEPGQLDQEIADGRWTVLPDRADLVFAREPLELWQRAIAAGGEVVVSLGQPTAASD